MTMFRSLAAAALVCAAAAAASAAQAASPIAVRYSFSLAPGGSTTISLPAIQSPIEVLFSETSLNGGTQTPSAVAHAVVNEDPRSLHVTWVGTKSDGTPTAGTSIPTGSPEVLDIGGGNVVITAKAGGKLVVTQSASRTAVRGAYILTFIY
jgi:hypothetical protein